MQMNPRLIAIGAYGTFALALAVRSGVRTFREERAKRQEINTDMVLDIQAIKNASSVVSDRIELGKIRSLDALREAVQNEIAFQKIAIRED